MMSSANQFWQAFELVPGLATSAWEWRVHLAGDSAVARRILRRTGDRVDCLPIGAGEPHFVVAHSNARVVAVAPDTNETTCIKVDDLAVLAINARALRRELATALALRTSTTTIERPSRFRVGTWEPQPSTAFPVFFAAEPDGESYDADIGVVATALDGPAIVLVPTRSVCSDRLIDASRRRGILIVPLTDVIDVDGDELTATEAWPDHLGAFCQLADVKLPSAFSNKRPTRKRASRAANIEALRVELVAEIRSRRDMLREAEDNGRNQVLPASPTKSELGVRVGLRPDAVSRCFSDSTAGDLKVLYDMLESPEDVRRFHR